MARLKTVPMPFVPLSSFAAGSLHICRDLAPLFSMIKTMSLVLSSKARERLAWMDAFRECGNASQVCRHFSIPLRTFWRWKDRYDPWNLKSLEDFSKKPKHSPVRATRENERAVLALKQAHPRWGREKLSFFLKQRGIVVSGKTCERLCKKHQLLVRYRTRKRKAPKPRVDWALVRIPGDLLEMDTKYVNWNGRRVFQYTLIDVVSRWRFCAIHERQDMKTTVLFLAQARKSSIFQGKMLQTDNGHEFGRMVTHYLSQHHIKHVFSHKARPQENGHVERSHRTDEEEFYSTGPLGATLPELRLRFARYVTMYNEERPHWGLQGKTPQQALQYYYP